MIGNGVSIFDLTKLLKAINDKDLVLQVKILDGEWADFDKNQLANMIQAILAGSLSSSADIRARLYAKNKPRTSTRP